MHLCKNVWELYCNLFQECNTKTNGDKLGAKRWQIHTAVGKKVLFATYHILAVCYSVHGYICLMQEGDKTQVCNLICRVIILIENVFLSTNIHRFTRARENIGFAFPLNSETLYHIPSFCIYHFKELWSG